MTEREVDDIVDESILRKRNVKDILIEMKDTSELMVDLAYSALLTNSKEIAKEVTELEKEMDDLEYEIIAKLMLSARTHEDAADLSGILRVAIATENISDSAEDIANVIIRGIGDHPIYRSVLSETEEQVVKVIVKENSELVGKTLGGVRMSSNTGCYIRAIKRGSAWIYNPNKNTKLFEDDVLIASGSESAVDMLKAMAK
ncbi:MAG: potassium channel protein [Candidatus Altiarchaeales archaeon HGW-Altiarchaeales-3]|nr:MAG: potassium channel protein [Candidatus Altiarchaeales archaeon HGW-Altiarchaeales-3]